MLGRVEVIEVGGFSLDETGPDRQTTLWLRGGYPRSYLAANESDSLAWRMLAHSHGQVWNATDPARSLGISEPTVRRYLDTLTQTFMVRQLQPWHENLGKRQVKSPKVYFRDSGHLHALLNLPTLPDLLAHPRSGASWEGFALEQVLRLAEPDEACFWATHNGAELDLLLLRGSERVGVEFKRADSPAVSTSMRIAMNDLRLDRLYVVYPGRHRHRLADGIEAVPLAALLG